MLLLKEDSQIDIEECSILSTWAPLGFLPYMQTGFFSNE